MARLRVPIDDQCEVWVEGEWPSDEVRMTLMEDGKQTAVSYQRLPNPKRGSLVFALDEQAERFARDRRRG